MRRRTHRAQPNPRCSCVRVTDTPEWHGAHSSGSGLSTRSAAQHGDVFAHTGGCMHSELSLTTKPRRKLPGVRVIKLQ